MEHLNRMLKGCANVYFITETLSKVEVNSLIKQVDVFVSLHRAEGFGLVMAEAMIVGITGDCDKLVFKYRIYEFGCGLHGRLQILCP